MRSKFELVDYETVTPSSGQRSFNSRDTEDNALQIYASEPNIVANAAAKSHERVKSVSATRSANSRILTKEKTPFSDGWTIKRGHSLSYLCLFAFTFLVYFRPYELFPSLAWLSRSALIVAIITLIVFVPAQLALENRITARPREVKLILALLMTGLLSIPLALEPPRAFQSFIEFFKVVVIFIVMVNVVRTERRLRGLILLVLFVSCVLSLAAINDYAHGNLALEGRRIAGIIGGLFSNPNDLALHLVTMIPISLTLFLGSRGLLNKTLYLICSLLLMAGMVATFSRGGFLGFVCVIVFLTWKLARRNRVILGLMALTMLVVAVTLAPSAYRSRLATTNDDSALARTDDLKHSILISARHPIFGVGMDNYILYSNTNKATHNAYTQVAAEMGVGAFLLYVGFLVTPFIRLRRMAQEKVTRQHRPRVYYLAIGLQGSLIAYMVTSFFASVAYLWYAYYLVAYGVALHRIYATVSEDSEFPRNERRKFGLQRISTHSKEAVVAGGN